MQKLGFKNKPIIKLLISNNDSKPYTKICIFKKILFSDLKKKNRKME